MYDFQLYDHLLSFQFFQGLSRTELLQLAGTTKFGFMKLRSGQTLVSDGDLAQQLFFVVKGTMQLTTASADGGYQLSEQLDAPWLLQPEALFGSQTRFTCTCKATDDCHLITLSKQEVLRLLDTFLIIRLNLLNIFSTLAQKRSQHQWRSAPKSLRQRFIRFLLDRSCYPAGTKQLYILMTRLADELGDSRLDTSRMLNQLQDEGLLTLHRGRICIHSLEKLLQADSD
ncbi:MAG: Crp/Fnr family transcriptional regulator [Prevotella sp.]|nr:Crp/Fnr family transcriptional regulator [Prevotella sp.]